MFLQHGKKPKLFQYQKTLTPADITTDLHPISLTPTLSQICELFVFDWLITSIKNTIDKRNAFEKRLSKQRKSLNLAGFTGFTQPLHSYALTTFLYFCKV